MKLSFWHRLCFGLFIAFSLLAILILRRYPSLVVLFDPPASILKTTQGRTNIVLLGLGGAGHEAPDLTDSLIFVSLNPRTRDVVLMSLPRDIWVAPIRAKINTSYYYGGLTLAKAIVSQFLGQPIHYAAALNFSGFTQAIDLIGGVDVTVPQTFDDYNYPIPGKETDPIETNRYERLHFDAGRQHFDGATALKYVRSRHALGDEGTDFAREQRQHQVIAAFRLKLLSPQTLTKLNLLPQLLSVFSASVIRDISTPELLSLTKLGVGLSSSQLRSGSLDNLLYHPPASPRYDSQWVLIPKDSAASIHQYVSNLLYQPNR